MASPTTDEDNEIRRSKLNERVRVSRTVDYDTLRCLDVLEELKSQVPVSLFRVERGGSQAWK
jgi:hypothetical protein